MRAVRRRDTGPELRIRRALWRLGFRYLVDYRHVPGKPDLAFTRKRKAIFVHGCFWHMCPRCFDRIAPKSRTHYWLPKLQRNVERDERVIAELEAIGWSAIVVYECQATNRKIDSTIRELTEFLEK